MGSISSGIGLVSGINSAQLIQQLIALESQGKIPLQKRVATLTTQRTALLDVNARLLNLRNASAKFRLEKVFQSVLATSSDAAIATAVADKSTPPGSYQLFVKQLASTSQLRSKGFATANATPLGLDAIRFEFGDVGVDRTMDLAALNGGAGVRRGKISLTDKSGASATVDLSTATTLGEVVQRINATDGIGLSARVEGERLVVEDTSGGSGQLKIQNAAGGFMATDLGIVGTTSGASITSTQINRLGALTTLASLNDRNGVLIRDDAVDFRLQVGGSTFAIKLGREDLPITAASELAKLNNGAGVAINSTEAPDLIIRTTTGAQVAVDLGAIVNAQGQVEQPAVATVQQLLDRVNGALADAVGAGNVTLSLRADGKGFQLADTLGGAEKLAVLAAGPNAAKTAQDLGIFTGPAGDDDGVIVGTVIKNQVSKPRAATIQDVIDRIAEQTAGAVTASINAAGTGLQLSAGGQIVTVLDGDGDGSSLSTSIAQRTARDLGLFGGAGTVVIGERTLAGLGTVLSRTLKGGAGMSGANDLTLTDRAGNSVTVGGLAGYETLGAIVQAVNAAASGAGVSASLSIDPGNSSLRVTDSSGGIGSLTISGAAAERLGIAGSAGTQSSLKGANLELAHVSLAQSVGSLNYGKGIGKGQFRITDSSGDSGIIDIDVDSTTLYDVIREINARGLKVEARVNANGDGIELVDTNADTPTSKLKVENVSGSVATALGILGEAKTIGGNIAGSYEKSVALSATDTLQDVIAKINAAGISVGASLVNTGSGATPFFLSLSSGVGGTAGRLLVDTGGVDLGLTVLSEGRDAEILFGDSDPALGLVIRSSTNQFQDIVGGLDVTATKASASPITIDVALNVAGIKESVKSLVTTFNDVIGRIGDYDKFDVNTKTKGVLLGDPTLARTRQLLYGIVQGKAKNVSGQYQFLAQVGIRVGKDGKLVLDEAKFDAAYAADPQAVERLFATFEQQAAAPQSVAPGVTVGSAALVSTALGFGDLLDQATKGLTSTVDGLFARASEQFQTLIDRTNSRITTFDGRLESRKTRLQRQFAAMEEAIAKLQSQQGALSSILQVQG